MCNVYLCLLIHITFGTLLYCIWYHYIISKFHSFLDHLPGAVKKIHVKSNSKAKVILNDGKKNTCQQYMYDIFNGRSIMEPQLTNYLLFFLLSHDQYFKRNTLKNIYI